MTTTPASTTTTTALSLRILIANDHDVMREGTRAVIERQPSWEVCGIAATGREAVAQAVRLQPDIVIMDMSMPDLNGLDAAAQIKRRLPRSEILMFTAHETDQLIRDVFAVGVKSFILKSEAHTYLIEAIQSLAQRSEPNSSGSRPGQRLSAREREIVQLLAEGKSNEEVAESLSISVRTAETHRASVLRKLNLDSIASLVRYAIRNKIIEP